MIRRIAILLISIIFVISLCAFPALATNGEQVDLTVSNGSHGIDASKPYLGTNIPMDNVKSAFLFETKSETLLYQLKADEPQYPASLVKIMTALLVLENCNLQDTVTVSQSALDSVSKNAISLKLQAGEQLAVEQLLYAMLVSSANDAAAILAEYTSGSVEAFVSKMNSRAEELGCTGTTFMNPHGLHHEEQITTARDVCRILVAALEHETFRTIFGTPNYVISATNISEERELVTNNHLISTKKVGIYKDERVIGGRCGVTNDGFQCIASLSQSGDMEVICIVMGCADKIADNGYSVEVYGGFPETIAYMNHAYENQSLKKFLYEGQILRRVPVINGDCDVFYTVRESFSAVLPSGLTLEQLSFRYQEVPGANEAPITAGENMAVLQVWHGDICIAQTDVYAANDVAVAQVKAGNYIKTGNAAGIVIIIVILVVLLLAVGAVVLRIVVRRKKPKNRGKKRRN